MKEKRKIELEEEEQNYVDSKKAIFDQTMRRVKVKERDEWINQLDHSALIQPSAVAQIAEPFISVVSSYHNLLESNSRMFTAASSIASVTHSAVSDSLRDSLTSVLGAATTAMKPYHDMEGFNFDILASLESAVMTPELLHFQTQFKDNIRMKGSGMPAILDYVDKFSARWKDALGMADIAQRSIDAQNFALVRILPDYRKLDLPRGSKSVLKSLTKSAAEKLTQTEDIRFDPREKEFYHKDLPEQKVTADQITVAESSQELFADISFDELVSFESQLYEDIAFAMEHPVGKKIFEIIKSWNKFQSFDDITYFHARKIENGKRPFLDQEMMKAPLNISSHGRYNAIGKNCYYIADTKDGAINEINKHSGSTKPTIQVAGLKPIKSVRLIDLSGEIKGINRFMEHMRFTVDNEEGKIIKEYLLPNFVASCCKKLGIEGIKYKSTGYNCCVLWKDDYFEFAEGSREIVEPI